MALIRDSKIDSSVQKWDHTVHIVCVLFSPLWQTVNIFSCEVIIEALY